MNLQSTRTQMSNDSGQLNAERKVVLLKKQKMNPKVNY